MTLEGSTEKMLWRFFNHHWPKRCDLPHSSSFSFSTVDAQFNGGWNLSPNTLKLLPWSKDFNLHLQRSSTSQVWVRLFGLAQQYWRPSILFAIASSVGTPICTDSVASKFMFDCLFGHFARVLVDVDLVVPPVFNVLGERQGFTFFYHYSALFAKSSGTMWMLAKGPTNNQLVMFLQG